MTARETPATARRRHKRHFERGAAAVEMALVLPVLLFLLMGMIDFGRAYSAQIQLSQAAREGVRLASLNTTVLLNSNPEVIDTGGAATLNPYGLLAIGGRVSQAAGGLASFTAYDSTVGCSAPTAMSSSACVKYCPVVVGTTHVATVVLTSEFTWITGISGISRLIMGGAGGGFPTPNTIQSTGVMRCTG